MRELFPGSIQESRTSEIDEGRGIGQDFDSWQADMAT